MGGPEETVVRIPPSSVAWVYVFVMAKLSIWWILLDLLLECITHGTTIPGLGGKGSMLHAFVSVMKFEARVYGDLYLW